MRITSELTDAAVLKTLGQRIERHRIETGLTQAELAEQAGIGKRTLERTEAGDGTELVTLIRVLRALKVLEGFERLIPELPPSPIEQLKLRGKRRQRVSHPRRRDRAPRIPPAEAGVESAESWVWETQPAQGSRPMGGSRRAKRKR